MNCSPKKQSLRLIQPINPSRCIRRFQPRLHEYLAQVSYPNIRHVSDTFRAVSWGVQNAQLHRAPSLSNIKGLKLSYIYKNKNGC